MAENVIVNGSARTWQPELAIDDLLDELLPAGTTGAERSIAGVAVAVNDAVVPRGRWSEFMINAGDRVEVVTAVQGG